MSDYDAETGEIMSNGAGERALRAQNDGWARRRAEDRGDGLASLYQKIARASQEIETVIATTKSGAHKAKYAPFDEVMKAVRMPLLKQGVLIRHGCERVELHGEVANVKSLWIPVYTDLIDADSGAVHRTKVPMPIAQSNPQAVGIAVAYGKRYTTLASLGLATGEEDTDAEGAMPRPPLPNQVTETELTRKLKKEMDGCKTLDDLDDWVAKAENKKRLQSMSEDERSIVTPHWLGRRKTLSEAS